jgi:hypothetical protein
MDMNSLPVPSHEPISAEVYAAAVERLSQFASIDQDTITSTRTIDGLNALLQHGQLAQDFATVVREHGIGGSQMFQEVRAPGSLHIELVELATNESEARIITYNGGVVKDGGVVERHMLVNLPVVEELRVWTSSMNVLSYYEGTASAVAIDYSEHVAFRPTNHNAGEYYDQNAGAQTYCSDNPESYSGYARCVQEMAKTTLEELADFKNM